MELTTELLERFARSFLSIFIQPYYYAGILIVILQYYQQIQLERKLFSTRLHSVLGETWRTVLWGWVAGLSASVVMAFTGATVEWEAIAVVWAVSIIMLLFRLRFLCMAYSTGVIGVLYALVYMFPDLTGVPVLKWALEPMEELGMSSLFALVAILHIIEALLVRLQGSRMASPIFVEGKRGKAIGGFQLQGFWPVPLFLLVPSAGGSTVDLPWNPLLGGGLWNEGWILCAFPVVIGFTEIALTRLPAEKVKRSSGLLLAYSAVLLLLAFGVEYWPILSLLAAAASIGLHELIIWYGKRMELQESPFFVHDERGLKILAVIPGSPAQELGIQAGEIIHKVNGIRTLNREELHRGLRSNSAFCKLEILDLNGQVRFVQRGLFAGEHHQLGIILSPDEEAKYVVGLKEAGFRDSFRPGLQQQTKVQ